MVSQRPLYAIHQPTVNVETPISSSKMKASLCFAFIYSCSAKSALVNAFGVCPTIKARWPSTVVFYGAEDDVFENLSFKSPVLQQVYPALLKHKEVYGNPNIPLGTSEGRKCQTLRRLHIQNKLTVEEVEWLDSVGFVFHSLEDVYKYADFDDLFERLVQYDAANPGSNFQVPKKYPEDPELGAWVTGIRRVGKDGVNPEHQQRLDEVGFAWKSNRKCGSKFMLRYREFVQEVEEQGLDPVLANPDTVKWIRAQQEALKRGSLSQTRAHYMGNLFGESWTSIGLTD